MLARKQLISLKFRFNSTLPISSMNQLRPLQGTILKITTTAALSLILGGIAHADLYWAATTGGTAAVGGTGVWNNATNNWDNAAVGGTKTNFSDGQNAVFEGTAPGTVTTTDDLNVGSITYTSTASAYTINNDYALTVSGGISNSSAAAQTINNGGDLTFQGAGKTISGTGTTNIVNTSNLTFQSGASAGSAVITNNGASVTFADTGSGGTATITNSGTVDISQSTGGTSFGTLTNQSGGNLKLGVNAVGLTNLTLTDGDKLSFVLGAPVTLGNTPNGSGQLTVTGLATGNVTAHQTDVLFSKGSNFAFGTFQLIRFGAGATVTGVDPSDFVLDPSLASQYAAVFTREAGPQGSLDITLTPVPEISSFMMPLLGAGVLFAFRRRSLARAAAATMAS